MNASQARHKYYDQYTIFEDLIRRFARKKIKNYKTLNKPLREIINDVAKYNVNHRNNLPIKKFKKHLLVRNWLAHQILKRKVPESYLEILPEMQIINAKIKREMY